MLIPPQYASFVFGVIQATITTGVTSAVATLRAAPLSSAWFGDWLVAWVIAWAMMLPIVIFGAPLMQRLMQAMTGTRRIGS
jgi:Protein of unknown function (DUF2798)